MDTGAIFCAIDDFCQWFEPWWEQRLLELGPKRRRRRGGLCLSEVMTILVGFHLSGYRTFKDYYLGQVLRYQRPYFPGLVSYNRFVELLPGAVVPLCCFLVSRFGQCSGISFIDSTKISVCHNRRIWSHKVMAQFAARGKTSVDWFYGFKLHLVINDEGELLGVKITAGNVDDREPVPELARALFGKLFGDRGYLSQALFEQLWEQGVQLITKLRKNMKNKLLPLFDKLLLRKRSIIETVNDQLKNISQIEHPRHRSPFNFFVNLMAGLVAYTFREKKPSLNIRLHQALPAVVL
jgi:Transposase DDE domain